jgi:tRNA threonylcarbamoyladenosine biosynthesis protein TsaE
VIHISHSPKETHRIALQIAREIKPGDCIALEGDLGAGKTHFVRGLVEGLGGEPNEVCSPTFVLLNVYPATGMTIYHLDAYRVGGSEEFEAIGFQELLEQKGLVVVEWASKVRSIIPDNCWHIHLTVTGKSMRKIHVEKKMHEKYL